LSSVSPARPHARLSTSPRVSGNPPPRGGWIWIDRSDRGKARGEIPLPRPSRPCYDLDIPPLPPGRWSPIDDPNADVPRAGDCPAAGRVESRRDEDDRPVRQGMARGGRRLTRSSTSRATPYEMGFQQGTLLRDDIREERPLPVRREGQGAQGRGRRDQARRPQEGDRRDRAEPAEVRPRPLLRRIEGRRRRGGPARGRRGRRQLHPRDVPLLRLRPGRLGHEGRHPLPRGASSITVATGSSRSTPSSRSPSPTGRSRSSTSPMPGSSGR